MNLLLLFGIDQAIFKFLLMIDSKVYWLFSQLYGLFLELAQAKIFDRTVFDSAIKNIYIVFSIVSLFLVTFVILKAIVNPDENKAANEIKSMGWRIILAMVLTILTPTIFNVLYGVQNAFLKYGVIQKILLQDTYESETTMKVYYYDDSFSQKLNSDSVEEISDKEILEHVQNNDPSKTAEVTVDMNIEEIKLSAREMAVFVLEGFFHPKAGESDTSFTVKMADFFTEDKKALWTGIGCAVGGVFVVGAMAVATVASDGAAAPGWVAVAGFLGGCAGAAQTVYHVWRAGEEIELELNYKKFTWAMEKNEMIYMDDFSHLPGFAQALEKGNDHMEYTMIISTIAGLLLCYITFSFCLDLGVRAVKLVLLEILAPICFMIGILPSKKDIIMNWVKMLFTVFMEVFVRIFCLCAAALVISRVGSGGQLDSLGFVGKAIVVMGIVTFVKQMPKFISTLTGIDSGNMKLGIKEKLAEGGGLMVGAAIGAGATTLARNGVRAARNVASNFEKRDGKIRRKEGVSRGKVAGSIFRGLGSTVAGTASGFFRGGYAAKDAKDGSSMAKAASKGAMDAVAKRDKRAAYKARHGGNAAQAIFSHGADLVTNIGKWAGWDNTEALIKESEIIDAIQSLRGQIDSKARDLILGDLEKGKDAAHIDYNTATHDMDTLRALQDKFNAINSAEHDPNDQNWLREMSAAREAYNQYLLKWQDELANLSLSGKNTWESKSRELRAALSDVRMSATEYRENVARNINKPYIASLNDYKDIIDDNKDLTLDHALLKDIKPELKIAKTELNEKIKKAQQKEKDKEGK